MSCSFSVCSLLTDVRESVSEIPRDPDQVKSMLFEHLGVCSKKKECPMTDAGTAGTAGAFRPPISYTTPDKLRELPSSIIEDLEMLQVKPKLNVAAADTDTGAATDATTVKGLYHYLFSPSSVYGTEHLPIWSKYYTTDIEYLKQTQTLLEMFDNELLERCIEQNTEHKTCVEAFATMKNTWSEKSTILKRNSVMSRPPFYRNSITHHHSFNS